MAAPVSYDFEPGIGWIPPGHPLHVDNRSKNVKNGVRIEPEKEKKKEKNKE